MSARYDWTNMQTWVLEIDGSPVELYGSLPEAHDKNPEWRDDIFAWDEIEEDGRYKSALWMKSPSRTRGWYMTSVRLYRHS